MSKPNASEGFRQKVKQFFGVKKVNVISSSVYEGPKPDEFLFPQELLQVKICCLAYALLSSISRYSVKLRYKLSLFPIYQNENKNTRCLHAFSFMQTLQAKRLDRPRLTKKCGPLSGRPLARTHADYDELFQQNIILTNAER